MPWINRRAAEPALFETHAYKLELITLRAVSQQGPETTPGKQDPPPGEGGRTVCVESQRRQTHDLLSSYSEIIFHACRFFVFT